MIGEQDSQHSSVGIAAPVVADLPIAVLLVDHNRLICWHNEHTARLVGRPGQNLISTEAEEFVQPKDRLDAKLVLNNLIAGKLSSSIFLGDLQLVGADGQPVSVLATARQYSCAKSGFKGLLIIISELDSRLRSKQMVLREQRYQRLFTQAPLGIMYFDQEGVIIDCNDFFVRIIGSGREALIGLPMLTGLRDERLQKLIRTALKGEEGYYEGDYQSVSAEKTTPVIVWMGPLYGPDGSILGGMAVCQDVSDMRKVENERRMLETRVQQGQKLESLGLLAGGIAHDFNNLITGLLGNVDMARMELPKDSAAHQYLDQIDATGRMAAEMTHQMLACAGQGPLLVEAVDLGRLIKDNAQLLRDSLNSNTELDIEVADDVPLVDCDTTQVRQVVINLVKNAQQAIGDGPGTIKLLISRREYVEMQTREHMLLPAEPEGVYCRITVIDSGRGMDKETLSKIFDPFFTTKAGGRGLGLAVVLGVVRAHKGAVKAQSTSGEGTTICVLLPASTSTAQTSSKSVSPAHQDAATTGARGILVVDDETLVRQVNRKVLELDGFKVFEAADGEEAIKLFRELQHEIGVVLLDINMPGMSGERVSLELARISGAVKIILTSGFAAQESISQSSSLGADGFLQKPYLPKRLLAKIYEVLQ